MPRVKRFREMRAIYGRYKRNSGQVVSPGFSAHWIKASKEAGGREARRSG
jgi:hypothetical protein